jgi:hypothetical protein
MRSFLVQLQAGRQHHHALQTRHSCPSPPVTAQVKFIFEAFSRMRPGVVLMALHGKVKQMKRIQVQKHHARVAK